MRLQIVDTGYFKLDGGAMFGVVPKSIWNTLNPADSDNMCTWAMRSLLIENGHSLILVDAGIGTKQSEKFFGYYHLHGEATLCSSLKKAGYEVADVTDVFLTHLHFDHVGGAVERRAETLAPTFPRARYWSNAAHWKWATEPNPREKASFLKENILPLQESGQLSLLNNQGKDFVGFEYLCVDGHTEKMMLPKISYKGRTLVFASDLIPSVGHIPLPYLMSYDVRPLVSMAEKKDFLQAAASEKWVLVLQHDPIHECCTVKFSEKGVVLDETFSLQQV
jgi:glyoxylase-like metal-dependent hydrolase (beta-lactamase superfamily II)